MKTLQEHIDDLTLKGVAPDIALSPSEALIFRFVFAAGATAALRALYHGARGTDLANEARGMIAECPAPPHVKH